MYIVRHYRPSRGSLWFDMEFDTIDGAVDYARAKKRSHPSQSVLLFHPVNYSVFAVRNRETPTEVLRVKRATPAGIETDYYVTMAYAR